MTVFSGDLPCNNTSHRVLCPPLKLQMVDEYGTNPNPNPDPNPNPNPNQVDEYGNPAHAPADDDDVPALRVRLEGPLTGDDDVYDEGARPPTLLPVP